MPMNKSYMHWQKEKKKGRILFYTWPAVASCCCMADIYIYTYISSQVTQFQADSQPSEELKDEGQVARSNSYNSTSQPTPDVPFPSPLPILVFVFVFFKGKDSLHLGRVANVLLNEIAILFQIHVIENRKKNV